MDYTVVPYRADLEKAAASLHANLIHRSPGFSRSYLRWKYRENPFIPSPLVFLVLRGQEVVGMRGMFGTAWTLDAGGEPVVLPHADDLVVRTDHRNRGLFVLLHRTLVAAARDHGYRALLSLSGGDVTQNLQLAAGWKALGTLKRIYRMPGIRGRRPWDLSGALLSRLPGGYRISRLRRRLGFGPRFLPSDQALDQVLNRMTSTGNPHILLSATPDHGAMAALAEFHGGDRVRSVRSEPFFRWRLSNPDRRYRCLCWRDSRLRGYMVLAWIWRDPERVIIADYAVEEESVLGDLLDGLARSESTEYWLMSSTLPDAHLAMFRHAGFVADPGFTMDQRRRFLFFPLSGGRSLASGEAPPRPYPGHWHVSYLDSMGA